MWRTPRGERILTGATGRLLREAIEGLAQSIEYNIADEQCLEYDLPFFDNLSSEQQLALLAAVGKGLLDETAPVVELTAITESAVAALLEYVLGAVDAEIENERFYRDEGTSLRGAFEWRRRILAAVCEDRGRMDDDFDDDRPPSFNCTSLARWRDEIEWIANGIFWDRDWEMDHLFMDEPPEQAAVLRAVMGIDDEYFAAVPPEPNAQQLAVARHTIADLTVSLRRKRPR